MERKNMESAPQAVGWNDLSGIQGLPPLAQGEAVGGIADGQKVALSLEPLCPFQYIVKTGNGRGIGVPVFLHQVPGLSPKARPWTTIHQRLERKVMELPVGEDDQFISIRPKKRCRGSDQLIVKLRSRDPAFVAIKVTGRDEPDVVLGQPDDLLAEFSGEPSNQESSSAAEKNKDMLIADEILDQPSLGIHQVGLDLFAAQRLGGDDFGIVRPGSLNRLPHFLQLLFGSLQFVPQPAPLIRPQRKTAQLCQDMRNPLG